MVTNKKTFGTRTKNSTFGTDLGRRLLGTKVKDNET